MFGSYLVYNVYDTVAPSHFTHTHTTPSMSARITGPRLANKVAIVTGGGSVY